MRFAVISDLHSNIDALGALRGPLGGISSPSMTQTIRLEGRAPLHIHYVTHHRTHAAAAFLPSPYDSAAILTVEENSLMGGFGAAVLESLTDVGLELPPLKRLGLPDDFVAHGSQKELREELGLDPAAIAASIEALYSSSGRP